jgi:hypothetical protein
MDLPTGNIELMLLFIVYALLFLWRVAGFSDELSRSPPIVAEQESAGDNEATTAQHSSFSKVSGVWLRRLGPVAVIVLYAVAQIQANFQAERRFPISNDPWVDSAGAIVGAAIAIFAWIVVGWDDRPITRGRMRMAIRGRYKNPALMDPRLAARRPEATDARPRRKRKPVFKRQL